MRLDAYRQFVVNVERPVGKFCASCTTGTEYTPGAAPPQVNCADERRSPSEGIRHVQMHVAEGSSPPAAWLSILVVGYAVAAVMVVLLWAGLHAGFF
jgi:hypothetical protein